MLYRGSKWDVAVCICRVQTYTCCIECADLERQCRILDDRALLLQQCRTLNRTGTKCMAMVKILWLRDPEDAPCLYSRLRYSYDV